MPRASVSQLNAILSRSLLLAALAGASLFSAHAAMAQATVGPFAQFDGGWRGTGRVSGADGKTERITCRAHYSIPPSGQALSQSLVCASDSYRFQVQSDVVVNGRNVEGEWQEATRNARGKLMGEASDGQFSGTVTGPGFTAEISIKMTGDKQAVVIAPHGSDVARVDIVLSREN
jgi:hypothetical protein